MDHISRLEVIFIGVRNVFMAQVHDFFVLMRQSFMVFEDVRAF